jgi:hypothetical protein
MTDQADLERGYRRLLAWYPPEFRRENGQEILTVLMAGARDGQRRPGLAESADLIRSGVWMRLRPTVPRSARTVRAAVRLMYAGAAVSTVEQIMEAALNGGLVFSLVVGVSPWLWMAWASGQGRDWARILSTVLFVLAMLELPSVLTQPLILSWKSLIVGPGFRVNVLYYGAEVSFVAAWMIGGAALWLLWLPASTAFFKPPRCTHAPNQAHTAERDRLQSSRARSQRQV